MGAALHEARQAMHALFPLTEEMWLSWLEDEKTSRAPQDRHALCTEAVQDYLSVPLWDLLIRYTPCTAAVHVHRQLHSP